MPHNLFGNVALQQIKNRPCNRFMLQGRIISAVPPCLITIYVTRLNGYSIALKAAFFRLLPACTTPARCCGRILGLIIATQYYM